jgi:hypothetical protein
MAQESTRAGTCLDLLLTIGLGLRLTFVTPLDLRRELIKPRLRSGRAPAE